jgi:hypothetical protein
MSQIKIWKMALEDTFKVLPVKTSRELPLRSQRCMNAKQMKDCVHDYVGQHLLGRSGFRTIEELVAKLEKKDPDAKSKWTEHRLRYHFRKVNAAIMLEQQNSTKHPAGGAPQEDHASGLDLTFFDDTSPEAPKSPRKPLEDADSRYPLGGRPKGTTKEAARAAKRVKAALVDSAVKAWKQKREYCAEERLGVADAYRYTVASNGRTRRALVSIAALRRLMPRLLRLPEP